MGLFRTGKPNVSALARRQDGDGLVAAAGFQDLITDSDGSFVDRGALVREEAILALGTLGPEAGLEAVRAALRDPSDAVTVAAVRVLYAWKDATSLAAALAWLLERPGLARTLTLRALAELRRPESARLVAEAVLRAAGSDQAGEDVTSLLAHLLQADEDSDAAADVVEALLVALADESDLVSERAEQLLVLLAPTSIEAVIAELKAGAAPHRAAAVLTRMKDTRALEPLLEGLRHRDPRVRAESAAALGELRDPAAVEALIHATRDPEHHVRSRAGSALDQFGMVALVVGVSTLVRPAIIEAIEAADGRPGVTKARPGPTGGNGTHGLPSGSAPTEAREAERVTAAALERLLEGGQELGMEDRPC